MPEANDPTRDLWLALVQPESLERIVETYRRIEELAQTEELPPQKSWDLRAQAFSAMRDVAGDDPARSRDLILRPSCCPSAWPIPRSRRGYGGLTLS